MEPESLAALERAAGLLATGRLAEAETICRRLTRRHPGEPDVLHLLALVRKQRGDFAGSEELFRDCLRRDPRRADVHANLANLLAKLERRDEAERAYRAALDVDRTFRPALLGLGRLSNRAGKHGTAREAANALIAANARDAEAWAILAAARNAAGLPDAAEAAWRQALEIDPDYGAAHFNLGVFLADAGRNEEALCELDRAAACGVNPAALGLTRAAALMGLNRLEEAEGVVLDAIRRDPADAGSHRLLGRLRYMRGKDDYADELARAAAARPHDTALLRAHARLLRGAGRLSAAATELRNAIGRGRDEPELLAELAAVHLEAGQPHDALRRVEAALAGKPGDPALDELLADVLLVLGRADDAMPLIRTLRARNPLNQWYVAMEATAARVRGDPLYGRYCDYRNLVRCFELAPPDGWSSIDDFHAELIPVLEHRHRFHAAPIDQSLRHGTQTPRNLLGDPDPRLRAFIDALEQPIAEYREAIGYAPGHPFRSRNEGAAALVGCWSVRLYRHGYHVNHVHSEGWISSAYFVDVPAEAEDEQAKAGWLKFGEPRFAVPGASPEMLVKPSPGTLVLFPSYLWHGTTPIRSDARRLTIAFDAVPRPGGS